MLSKVKQALRILNTAFDTEIQDLIDSAKADLALGGIKKLDEADANIQRAIILYCKAEFGLENKDSDKYMKSYMYLKSRLSLSKEYLNVI